MCADEYGYFKGRLEAIKCLNAMWYFAVLNFWGVLISEGRTDGRMAPVGRSMATLQLRHQVLQQWGGVAFDMAGIQPQV